MACEGKQIEEILSVLYERLRFNCEAGGRTIQEDELVELASSLYGSHFHESVKQPILDTRFSGEVSYEPGPHSGRSGVNAIMSMKP